MGAGPAGGELARLLACAGVEVLLVDQLTDLSLAAFSSAALPLEAVERFALPASVVAHRWSDWQLYGPGEQLRRWSAVRPLGAVLDFAALRRWLADQVRGWGGRVELGLRALRCEPDGPGSLRTLLRDRDGSLRSVSSAWVIDASGQQRALIGDPPAPMQLVSGLGVEWLVQVDPALWQRWSGRLSFCLGSDWVPQGYGWLFPMQPGLLKLGVCRLEDPRQRQPPLAGLQRRLIERLFSSDRDRWTVIDRHGGRIRSTVRRREAHRRGRLIALGDAVSTANLLGGEGIRHALTSSRVLAPLLLQALDAVGSDPLATYPGRLRRSLGPRWTLSGRLARRTWLALRDGRGDQRLQRLLQGLEGCDAEDLSALLFDYRFERYGLRALPYLLGLR